MLVKEYSQTIVRACLDLLFPPACPCCKKPTADNNRFLCLECYRQLRFIKIPYCSYCGKALPGTRANHLCKDCIKPFWTFDRARSLLIYEKVIARLIHNLKYSGDMTGIITFCRLARQSNVLHDLATADLIVPVPLHIKRLRQRGFNQALILARNLFPTERHIIRCDLLIRKRDTHSQTDLSGTSRRKNLKNAFIIEKPEEVNGRNILLFDDVFTTGTTAQECAKTLKRAGSNRVEVLTICRADKTFD